MSFQFSTDQVLAMTRQLPDEIKWLLIQEWIKELSEKDKSLDLNKFFLSEKQPRRSQELKKNGLPTEELAKFITPMRKKTDVEQLKKEQNYKPVDKQSFVKKINELNIEEPLEDLLKMI